MIQVAIERQFINAEGRGGGGGGGGIFLYFGISLLMGGVHDKMFHFVKNAHRKLDEVQ